MKIKAMTETALLLSLGFILHVITPSYFGSMKPDFMLIMMFISIIRSENITEVIAIGILSGFLSGFSSLMPYGFITNFIEKIISSLIMYKYCNLFERKIYLMLIGSIISGIIFLFLSFFLIPLTLSLTMSLFLIHVVPASVINSTLYFFVEKTLKTRKRLE